MGGLFLRLHSTFGAENGREPGYPQNLWVTLWRTGLCWVRDSVFGDAAGKDSQKCLNLRFCASTALPHHPRVKNRSWGKFEGFLGVLGGRMREARAWRAFGPRLLGSALLGKGFTKRSELSDRSCLIDSQAIRQHPTGLGFQKIIKNDDHCLITNDSSTT